MSFRVHVDPTNPGQFFACGGLLELAARISKDARGYFTRDAFQVETNIERDVLLERLATSAPLQLDPEDDASSALRLESFELTLDWWNDIAGRGRDLKVWAGSMQCARIARAMLAATREAAKTGDGLLDYGAVVYEPADPSKKVEPFYFDARRAPNAHSRDIGFSPNDLELTTIAFPAVEALCLIGIQRFRPRPLPTRRMFEYRSWPMPLAVSIASAVASGAVELKGVRIYQFENWFRTGQKKQKAFRPASFIEERE